MNFVLRKITRGGQGDEINISLGANYTVVLENQKKDSEKVAECKAKGIITDDPIIFGYVVGEDLEVHELSVQNRLYIMTGNGKTFDRLHNRL